MSWPINPRPAKSLIKLRDQVNLLHPGRATDSDGMLGDASHAATTSDHNPDNNGVVTAMDITHDPAHGMDTYKFAEMLLHNKDERIKYVISNRKIASGTGQSNPAWVWRPYTGVNPHDQHIHISVKDVPAEYDAVQPWLIDAIPADPNAPPVVSHPVLKLGSTGPDVRIVQELLQVDGIYGTATQAAVKAFQRANDLVPDGQVGQYTWDALLKQTPAPEPTDGWQTGITATEFGGDTEVENSAYDNHRIDNIELSVALPFRFTGIRPVVEVRTPGGQPFEATIQDIGPWNINDPYWKTNSRPQAESGIDNTGRRTNLAGIDLSPALARKLGISGKGKVDWRFKPADASPNPQP